MRHKNEENFQFSVHFLENLCRLCQVWHRNRHEKSVFWQAPSRMRYEKHFSGIIRPRTMREKHFGSTVPPRTTREKHFGSTVRPRTTHEKHFGSTVPPRTIHKKIFSTFTRLQASFQEITRLTLFIIRSFVFLFLYQVKTHYGAMANSCCCDDHRTILRRPSQHYTLKHG